MGTFLEPGKNKAAKEEGWVPPFFSCAQAIHWDFNLTEMKNLYLFKALIAFDSDFLNSIFCFWLSFWKIFNQTNKFVKGFI